MDLMKILKKAYSARRIVRLPLEPFRAWSGLLTYEYENVEIASQEPGGRKVAFDENAESCGK